MNDHRSMHPFRSLHRAFRDSNLVELEDLMRWMKTGALLVAGTALCVLALGGCTVEEIETYTQNDALLRGDTACQTFLEEVVLARERIDAVPPEELLLEEAEELEALNADNAKICDKDPMTGIDIFTVEQATKEVRFIDGLDADELRRNLF